MAFQGLGVDRRYISLAAAENWVSYATVAMAMESQANSSAAYSLFKVRSTDQNSLKMHL